MPTSRSHSTRTSSSTSSGGSPTRRGTSRRNAAVALAVLVALAGCTSSKPHAGPSTSPSPATIDYTAPPDTLPVPGSTVALSTGPAPWPPPAVIANGKDSVAYVAAAGLPYNEEMLQVHYHAHLDVVIDGKPAEVPPYLGFVVSGNKVAGLAPLHTHDSSGVIHIENKVPAKFLLGQLFVEWGVRLSATCVGGYCADATHDFAVFVNGSKYAGDPNQIVLTKHEEIAVEYGAKGKLPAAPSSYTFSNGL